MPHTILPIDWRPIRHVVLDFGGVLYNIDHQRSADAFDGLGMSDFQDMYAHGKQSRIMDDFERGLLSEDQFLTTLLHQCADGTTLQQVRAAWNAVLIGPQPNIMRAIRALSNSHDLLLFSNTNSIHAAHFEPQIIEELGRTFHLSFRQIVYSHRLGHRKPDREAYDLVNQTLGLNPEQTLFVDDTPTNVHAARLAGWNAVYYNPSDYSLDVLLKHLDYPS